MKYSRQRELILRTVQEHPIHPTADDVYAMLKQTEPNLSLGTVYRNLNFLADHKMIRKILVPNASDRFDGMMDDHHHMLCTQCGEIFDLEHDLAEELSKEILQKTGFQMNRCGLMVLGICARCRKESLIPATELRNKI